MRPPTASARRAIAIAIALIGPLCAMAHAQDGFVVIVNEGNSISTLPRGEASKLFLRKRIRWPNGQKAQPMDLVESSPVRRSFSNVIHGMDVPSVKSFWQEIVFSGKGDPPPERASDAEVIAFVKANLNAVGYIGSATPADGVKIITVTP
jgi:ABC-type phosphate transport system substrate-binding protein